MSNHSCKNITIDANHPGFFHFIILDEFGGPKFSSGYIVFMKDNKQMVSEADVSSMIQFYKKCTGEISNEFNDTITKRIRESLNAANIFVDDDDLPSDDKKEKDPLDKIEPLFSIIHTDFTIVDDDIVDDGIIAEYIRENIAEKHALYLYTSFDTVPKFRIPTHHIDINNRYKKLSDGVNSYLRSLYDDRSEEFYKSIRYDLSVDSIVQKIIPLLSKYGKNTIDERDYYGVLNDEVLAWFAEEILRTKITLDRVIALQDNEVSKLVLKLYIHKKELFVDRYSQEYFDFLKTIVIRSNFNAQDHDYRDFPAFAANNFTLEQVMKWMTEN